MAIVRTEFTVVNADSTYQIPGDWSAAAIIQNYSSQVPGIGNMSYTEAVETRTDGQVKVITFSPRTGTKG